MRLLQVCNKIPFPAHDGGSVAIMNLNRGLAKLGHEVALLAMETRKHPLRPCDRDHPPCAGTFFSVRVNTGFRPGALIRSLFGNTIPYMAARFVSASFDKELSKIAAAGNFDIIQLEGSYLLPYISTLRRHTGALIALRSHNIEHVIWERMAKERHSAPARIAYNLLARRLKKFESRFLNKCDLLVPITSHDDRMLKLMGSRRPSFVCRSGYDVADIPAAGQAHRSVYFLGSLDWLPNRRGLSWFISGVLPGLRRKYPDLLFSVAGRNAPHAFVRRLIRAGVRFIGEVADARSFVLSQGILVVPLFSGSGMRVKIIEAMALGKAVVTTPTGAEGLDAADGRELLMAHDAESFMSHLFRLLDNPACQTEIGARAKEFVLARYNNDTLVRGLADFYREQSLSAGRHGD